ncbi:MAG: class I SAM-dependent methyltransferase [Myxococcales bacterium]|nr:class I SAM-dependent methyltransferase [Myxococcales bacterium]
MRLPRVQSFELNDHPRVPAVLRDTIVETLSRTLRWGKVIDGLAHPFARFLGEANTSEVLDLGSGAGGPASILAEHLAARGSHVRFLLSDLFPRVEVWRRLKKEQPHHLDFVPDPVDATNIPAHLSDGRARAILNVLHHLPPELAGSVVRSAVRARAPLFIAEGFERNPLGFLPFAATGIPALLLSPVLAHDRHLERALLAWASPVAVLASAWDGFVSTMRVYDEEELRDMTRGEEASDDYTWSYGVYSFPFGGRGYYFMGTCRPRRVMARARQGLG